MYNKFRFLDGVSGTVLNTGILLLLLCAAVVLVAAAISYVTLFPPALTVLVERRNFFQCQINLLEVLRGERRHSISCIVDCEAVASLQMAARTDR